MVERQVVSEKRLGTLIKKQEFLGKLKRDELRYGPSLVELHTGALIYKKIIGILYDENKRKRGRGIPTSKIEFSSGLRERLDRYEEAYQWRVNISQQMRKFGLDEVANMLESIPIYNLERLTTEIRSMRRLATKYCD